MDKKKVLFIIVFVTLVIVFGAMIYFVFIRDLISPANENGNVNIDANENISLPNINAADIVNVNVSVANVNRLSNVSIRTNINGALVDNIAEGGVTLAEDVTGTLIGNTRPIISDQGLQYYDVRDQKIYRIDETGTALPLSDQLFPEVEKIAWSPRGDKAIITFPDNSKIMYDFNNQTQVTLPREWDDISFSENGEKIAFKNITSDEDSRWLAISNPDGSEVALIEPIGDKSIDVAVNWSPTGQVVATYREAYSGTSQEVYFIGLQGENFKSLKTNGRGFEGIWSPDGTQMLYSVFSPLTNYNPTLYLVDAVGDFVGANEIQLGLQTWSSKCTFSSQESFLYCAVPRSLPTGSGISPEVAGYTNDIIYQININNGDQSIIALPTFNTGDRDYAISSLYLSPDENTLYFLDQGTAKLYSIQI